MAENQVDLLLSEIKKLAGEKASNEDMATKLGELKSVIEKRDAEIDSQMGNMETKFESKMADLVGNINTAFKNVHGKTNNVETKYGKCFGEFLKKVSHNSLELKDLAEGTGSAGGYLVPEQYASEILRIDLENSVIRQAGARVIPVTSNIIKFPAFNMASNASGSLFGGASAYWGTENATLTESQPTFKQVKLELNKLYAYTEDPNELESDSIVSMGGLLTQMFGEALAFEEGVNYTAGLPIVRTSPDHGTAFDIVGEDKASGQSMRSAIYLAMDVYRKRQFVKEISANPLQEQKRVEDKRRERNV
jgi:HK97 family phage major capsid protein